MNTGNEKSLPDMEVDLVVIGGGGAGLPAALAAKENGASRVLVLEKRAVLGGNAARAWGLFAAESPVQKQEMVVARKDDLFKTSMNWSHWSIDPGICRALIEKSAETISWFEKKGIEFNLLRYFPGQEPPVWHVPKGHGIQLMTVLGENCKDMGVKFLLQTRCKKLLYSQEGKITGVLAEREGKEFSVSAKGVVVSTGGYGGNKELLKKHCSYYDEEQMKCFGLPHSGDGLQMAVEIGAAAETLGLLHLEWPHVHNDPGSVLTTLAREPYMVYINKKGERFLDESQGVHAFVGANAIIRQPEKKGFVLLDDQLRRSIEEKGADLGRGNDRAAYRRGMPGLEEALHQAAGVNKERVKISADWADIAEWVGGDPRILASTIDKYNDGCDRGHDPVLFKDPRYLVPLRTPPFYAIKA